MGVVHVEDREAFVGIAPDDKSLGDNVSEYVCQFLDSARRNERDEKCMSLKQGLSMFPKAVMWSLVVSSAIIMEGYDTNLMNSLYGFPAFAKKYGEYYEASLRYEIPAKWQTSINMAINVGTLLGLSVSGWLIGRWGNKKVMLAALVLLVGFIFVLYFAVSIQMLLVSMILLGSPLGTFQAISTALAVEFCPMVLRVYLTSWINVCWTIGQLILSGVLRGFVNGDSELCFKVPFAIQWVWPVPIFVAVLFCPESPWWLVRNGRLEEAEKSLLRLISIQESHKRHLADAMVKKIQMTLKEEEASANDTYLDCFRGPNSRRTRISACTWMFQNLSGSALIGYSSYFYIQAGLSTDNAYTFSIIQYILGILGTLTSWVVSQRYGRFQIYSYGLVFLFLLLMTIGGIACSSNENAPWAIGSLLLVYTYCYNTSIGPLTYTIVAEIPSTVLRVKTIIIARNTYNIAGIFTSLINPYMLNPSAWNWGAKLGFFWGGFALLAFTWSYFDLPETKDRTFYEIDYLFNNNVPARKFKSCQIDAPAAQQYLDNPPTKLNT